MPRNRLCARRIRIWNQVFRCAQRTGKTEHEIWNILRQKTGMSMMVRNMTTEQIALASAKLGEIQ